MSDKRQGFPYIIVPLSSEDSKKTDIKSPSAQNVSQVPAPDSSPKPSGVTSKTVLKSDKVKTLPKRTNNNTQLTAMARHIALSRQFTDNADTKNQNLSSNVASSLGTEIRKKDPHSTAHQKDLMAQYEMRKSPRSFYAGVDIEKDIKPIAIISQPEVVKHSPSICDLVSASSTLMDLKTKTRLTMEAMSHIFPQRSQKLPTTRSDPIINSRPSDLLSGLTLNKKSSITQNLLVDGFGSGDSKNSQLTITTSGNPATEAGVIFKDRKTDDRTTSDNLQSRVDGLTVHVKCKDAEVMELKQHVIDLQLLLLKEKKESKSSMDLVERLTKNVILLEQKFGCLQKTVESQENNIINRLMLMDEMECSDSSDSEYAVVDSRDGCSCSNNRRVPIDPSQGQGQGQGINGLKECMNWIPIAPDFNKLLHAISSLNHRMDKNQSMKMSRTGTKVSFKHADTIPLSIYRNGISLGNSGFRSYATLSVIKLVNEIFNGYFPSELHTQFPDGVIFIVSDKRSLIHTLNQGFNGSGVKLCDSQSTPILLPGAEKLRNVNRIECEPKVPEKAVSETAVFDTSIHATPSVSTIALPDIVSILRNRIYDQPICLKLKNIHDGRTYRFKLPITSTIDEILLHLERNLNYDKCDGAGDSASCPSSEALGNVEISKTPSTKYDIILPFPHGILTSGSSTLKEYGLVTNTLLYFKPSISSSIES